MEKGEMKVADIIKEKQPEVHRKLNKKSKRKRKRRERNKHLSFSFFSRLMQERTDVDESKCNGR
jgi:hypothetical protein